MTQGRVARLWHRLTGRTQLERLAALEATVGKFGRAQREDLAAQQAQVARISEELAGKAEERAVRRLERRLDDIQTSLVQQDRDYGAALERAGGLDEQGVDGRRFARRIEQMLRHDRPIIVGPWTGEVGLRAAVLGAVRAVGGHHLRPRARTADDRLARRRAVLVRGPRTPLRGDVRPRLDRRLPAATETAKKQRQVGAFDADVLDRVATALRLERPALLHPGMMYRLFMPFWKDIATAASRGCVHASRASDGAARSGRRRAAQGLRRRPLLFQRLLPRHAREPRAGGVDARRREPPFAGRGAQHAVRRGRPPRRARSTTAGCCASIGI